MNNENKLTEDDIRKLYYNPRFGMNGPEKFYKKLKKIDDTVKLKDVKEIINKQSIQQIFKMPKTKFFNSVVASYPNDVWQVDFIIYDRYEQNHYKYIFCAIALPTPLQ
jgi:hypothetical protein